MKNRKKAISLVLTALTVVSLSSCFEVSESKNGEILNYEYNGQNLVITSDDLIEKYLNESRGDHAKALYDALYEIVVRRSFEGENAEAGILAKYKEKVVNEAKQDVENAKDEADNNKQSWHDYLVEKGYNDANTSDSDKENELYLDKLYDRMKKRVDDEFENEFYEWKKEENEVKKTYNLIWGENGYLNKYLPYHVRHILVKSDATSENAYSRGHITADNATKLYNTVNALVNGDTFTSVAKNFTDDTASAPTGGEYIMDTKTSFVNEFQLGIYAYDTLLHPEYTDQENYDEKAEALHIPETVAKELKTLGPSFIPYGVVNKIYEKRNINTTEDGLKIYDGDEDYLPRNIYYNKYFQNRNVGFITSEAAFEKGDFPANGAFADPNTIDKDTGYSKFEDGISGQIVFTDINKEGHYLTSGKVDSKLTQEQLKNFRPIEFEKLNASGKVEKFTKNVLCDTEGNPILVVRNQETSGGTHFIIIERSAFDVNDKHFDSTLYRNEGATGTDEEIKAKYHTELNEYYATTNPKTADGINQITNKPYYVKDGEFPSVETTINGEKVFIPKKTYVQTNIVTDSKDNYVNDTVENYNKRVSSISDSIKKQMDGVNQFTKYYWLNENHKLELGSLIADGQKVQPLVDNYIKNQQKTQERTDSKALQDKWNEYMAAINKQNWERRYNLLPEILAADFGNAELYKKGAPGYNKDYYDATNKAGN